MNRCPAAVAAVAPRRPDRLNCCCRIVGLIEVNRSAAKIPREMMSPNPATRVQFESGSGSRRARSLVGTAPQGASATIGSLRGKPDVQRRHTACRIALATAEVQPRSRTGRRFGEKGKQAAVVAFRTAADASTGLPAAGNGCLRASIVRYDRFGAVDAGRPPETRGRSLTMAKCATKTSLRRLSCPAADDARDLHA